MLKNIHYPAPERSCPGILHRAPESKLGVVLIHEWWGINDNIRLACERLAKSGFTTIAPDLYHGFSTRNAQMAEAKMKALDPARAVEDIRAAATYLRKTENCRSVAVLGFCMGGALTLRTALNGASDFQAAVCFYGIPGEEAGDLSKMKIPVQGHFASKDEWCTPTAVDQLEKQLKKSGNLHEIHRYDASHAFANEKRPEVYHRDSAEQAWSRSMEFLKKTLSS